MRGLWVFVAAVLALAPRAGAGGGSEYIDIQIESGLVELSIILDPPDGPPSERARQVIVGDSVSEFLRHEDPIAHGDAFFEFSSQPGGAFAFMQLQVHMDAGQSDFSHVVTIRVRTINPIVFRLSDEVALDLNTGGGFITLTPLTGTIDGDVICPGTYGLSFDETLTLGVNDLSEFAVEMADLQLSDTLGPEARFTGAGELFVTGNSTDDQGDEDSAFAQGGIGDAQFDGGGGTSSGPVQGMAQSSGQITEFGDGAYTLTLSAAASASQPAGYQGSCFIGVFGEGIILELTKPKRYTVSGAPSVSLTPTTGSVSAGVLGPGRYRLDFSASASISPGQSADSESIGWTLELRTPGCSGADLADPSGVLNFSDVSAFLVAFAAAQPAADLAPPFGVWNFSDVLAFLALFGAGCP